MFLETLNTGWVDDCLAELKGVATEQDTLGEGRVLIEAIRDLPKTLEALERREPPPNLYSTLVLASAAYVVSEARHLAGAGSFVKKLTDCANAREFGQFFDTLWEGEVAVYFRNTMRSPTVKFEPGSHPDVWASGAPGGPADLIPIECKRISPIWKEGEEISALADGLFRLFIDHEAESEPLKVIVWLHEDAERIDPEDVFTTVVGLAERMCGCGSTTGWSTATSVSGTFQVSVALAGDDGRSAERSIEIKDVPAKGTLLTSVVTQYLGKPQDPVRLRGLLQIRSDVLPHRIGRLEANLEEAIEQVANSTGHDEAGVVALRLRPPRGKGDLYEADRIVRRKLAELNASHVGLVCLFWNESERQEEPRVTQLDGTWSREVVQGYHLKPYFIPNRQATRCK